jgi:6-phosphofructokinase 1
MPANKTVVVGQSGGPTAAINASLTGTIEGARVTGAPVLGMRHGVEGLLRNELMDLGRTFPDEASLDLLVHTPSSYLGSCRYKLPEPSVDEEPYRRILEVLEEHGVGSMLYIGGNDSMDTISKLSRYGASVDSDVRFVGVPKTIDNDLVLTDHTPGYGSAARFIATCVRELRRDSSVYDLRSVTVVETMGRDAGWLAGSACLAADDASQGADLILLPEVPLDEERFVGRVSDLLESRQTILVVASEGIRDRSGSLVCERAGSAAALDAFGHIGATSGTGRYLSSLLHSRLGVKSRAIELSTLQRCAAHLASATDLSEARALGRKASEVASRGETGVMTSLRRLSDEPYRTAVETVDVDLVANRERKVPASWIAPNGMGVTSGFEAYVRPLVQGQILPPFRDGLPVHTVLP